MVPKIRTLLIVGVASAAGVAGYRMVRSDLSAQVYHERLKQAQRDYDQLRNRYNTVVKKTAVAHLVVEGGALSVEIRTADGTASVIHTPYDPYGEIYLDYLVFDGRLWIRRVYDALTPPAEGLLIDPLLEEMDWANTPAAHGKAIYRQLGEGTWVVSVTGDGSLGLSRATDNKPGNLTTAPAIRDYEQLDEQARAAADQISVGDVARHLWDRAGADPE